jgi:pimeloyl-ACP methyl ester carboxylesterase
MITGDTPRFCDPAALARIADANPAIQLVTVPSSGDLPHWEQPASTLDRIRTFLALE